MPREPQRRGVGATEKIFQAALEVAETEGLDAVTTEGLATRLGIAKTTIYRRWPNIGSLLAEAVLAKVTQAAPIIEQTTVRETFSEAMKRLVALYASPHGNLLRSLIGRAQANPELNQQIAAKWVEPRRKIAIDMLRRAADRNEITSGVDPHVILDCLYGPIYHRLLLPYEKAELNETFVEQILEVVFSKRKDTASHT